jgi:ABC-type phosphate transport system auxiliary subunit
MSEKKSKWKTKLEENGLEANLAPIQEELDRRAEAIGATAGSLSKFSKYMEDQVRDLQSKVQMLQSRLVEKNAVIEELNDSHREQIEYERQSYEHLKQQFDEKYLEVERLELEVRLADKSFDEYKKLLKESEQESKTWEVAYDSVRGELDRENIEALKSKESVLRERISLLNRLKYPNLWPNNIIFFILGCLVTWWLL